MKVVVQQVDKMLVQELTETVSMHGIIVNCSLRIFLVSMAFVLAVLSVVLVGALVMASLN